MTFTGPADSLYYDILVSGFDIYGEQVGDGFNGAGEFGYVIATGYTAPLQGPGPMGQQAEKRTHWVLGFGISLMKGVFIILPQAAIFLRSTFTQKIPISTPTPFLYKAWVMTVCLLK